MAGLPGRYRRYDWSMRGELGEYWDFAIWLDCPYDIRLRRGLDRDGEAMGSQWTDVWIPEEDTYFNAERPDMKANLVIDSTKPYEI